MRKALLSIFFICFMAGSANAELHSVAVSALNIRSCPGTHCNIVGKLKQNDEVIVEKVVGEWVQIKTNQGSGFVVKKYLEMNTTNLYIENAPNFYILLGFFSLVTLLTLIVLRSGAKRDRELLQTVTVFERGTSAERDLVMKLLKSGIPAQTIFHDLYVLKLSGGFSQIDLVVVTKVGIIVFEVKDYSGWIFGNGNQTNWTKVLAYGREKYRFYNPIMQNKGHIAQLRKRLGENVPFYSVIVFYGNCELRDISFVPEGTFIVRPWRVLEVVGNIINDNEPANYASEQKIIEILKESVENGNNADAEIQHIGNIKDMLGHHRIFY